MKCWGKIFEERRSLVIAEERVAAALKGWWLAIRAGGVLLKARREVVLIRKLLE